MLPRKGSGSVFQCNVSKSIDLLIFGAIQQVRLRNKRKDSSAIFKETSKAMQLVLQKKMLEIGLKV